MMTRGQRLQSIREGLGLSRSAMAAAVGVGIKGYKALEAWEGQTFRLSNQRLGPRTRHNAHKIDSWLAKYDPTCRVCFWLITGKSRATP